MGNGPWQVPFAESSTAEGAVICLARERGQMPAGHYEFRESNRPIRVFFDQSGSYPHELK